MYKKYSDTPIEEFINLGNNTYEFCFDIIEYDDDITASIKYKADVILITDMSNILDTLLKDKYNQIEELKILNLGLSNQENSTYVEYCKYIKLINNKYNKYYLSKNNIQTNTYSNNKAEYEYINKQMIFRFKEQISDETYTYDEYTFFEISKINDIYDGINIINNLSEYILSDNQCTAIMQMFNAVKTLVELKEEKIKEFDPILNTFSNLIYRCKLLYPNDQNLDTIIETVKIMKTNTLALINSYSSISDLLKFIYKSDDINRLKNVLKPYLY